jgi:hypothetical protein
MTIKKEYIILISIIGLLTAYLLVQNKDRTHYELPEIRQIEKSDITKIKIKRSGSEIILSRENDAWVISSQNFPADSRAVENMLDAFAGLTLTALVSESKNYSRYELDEDRKIGVEAFTGDNSLQIIEVGKPASSHRHTFIRLADDHRIFHAENNLRSTFDKTVSGLRDKVVMRINEEIGELILRKGEEELSLSREEPPISVEPGQGSGEGQPEMENRWITADGRKPKDSEVNDIVNTLSNFSCDGYIEDKGKEDFASPVYSVTLKGLKEYSVSFFEKQGDKYEAISSESNYPFLISGWKAEKVMKDFDALIRSEEE